MSKKIPHHIVCEASICNDDPNPTWKDDSVWIPGELICGKKPYKKFQKIQIEINKLIKQERFRNVDKRYTARMLEEDSI